MIQLLHGDCLELMKDVPDKSIDMVLCDLPYGILDFQWDEVIDGKKLFCRIQAHLQTERKRIAVLPNQICKISHGINFSI